MHLNLTTGRNTFNFSEEDVPTGFYTLPLGKAEVLQEGSDITLIGYGTQVINRCSFLKRFYAVVNVFCAAIDR